MRGVFLIGTLLALVIAGLITTKRHETVPKPVTAALDPDIAQPQNMKDVPDAVRKQLERTTHRANAAAMKAAGH